jgi:hypothetical protein
LTKWSCCWPIAAMTTIRTIEMEDIFGNRQIIGNWRLIVEEGLLRMESEDGHNWLAVDFWVHLYLYMVLCLRAFFSNLWFVWSTHEIHEGGWVNVKIDANAIGFCFGSRQKIWY